METEAAAGIVEALDFDGVRQPALAPQEHRPNEWGYTIKSSECIEARLCGAEFSPMKSPQGLERESVELQN